MLKIAATGADGLIGSRVVELLKDYFQFIPISQLQMNITDINKVNDVLNNLDFDILLHLAGFTDVDRAEKDKEIVYKVNVKGTKNVFDATVKLKKKFIYISTDFVFDGKQLPYFEDSQPNPLNYYAQTKYEGEKITINNAMIVRLSYPYRKNFEPKKDFVRNIKQALEQKKTLPMVTNSLFTPTFIDDIAYALKYLVNNFSPEIFHIVGANSLSPYDAGHLIAKTFGLDESLIQKTTFADYSKNHASRPQYSDIRSKKNNFYKMKTFEEGLLSLV